MRVCARVYLASSNCHIAMHLKDDSYVFSMSMYISSCLTANPATALQPGWFEYSFSLLVVLDLFLLCCMMERTQEQITF